MKDKDIPKWLEECKWTKLDVLGRGKQAVGVHFPKPRNSGDAWKINTFLSGAGNCADAQNGNDWAVIKIKNVDVLQRMVSYIDMKPISELVKEATWDMGFFRRAHSLF